MGSQGDQIKPDRPATHGKNWLVLTGSASAMLLAHLFLGGGLLEAVLNAVWVLALGYWLAKR
jgi:hypothetical protein